MQNLCRIEKLSFCKRVAYLRCLALMRIYLCLLFSMFFCAYSRAQVPETIFDQMTTADHLKQPGWWPLKAQGRREDYVGAAVCAECHQSLGKSQNEHSMAHTAMIAADSPLLKSGKAQYVEGRYSYDIEEKNHHAYYSITDHLNTILVPLLWAFGSGSVGQSYLFEHGGQMFEARISFIQGKGFGLTPGHQSTVSGSLEFALGRPIPLDEQVKCFGCHTVASSPSGHFDTSQAMLGISCEGCHGPGGAHVAIAKSGLAGTPGLIFNPARLTPPQSLDFCGACHRAYWDVADVTDIHAVRFPALRLEQSKCWGTGDVRLQCTACHNPHQPLIRETKDYDGNCLSCHRAHSSAKPSSGHRNIACPVAANNCVSCHMRKYEITGMRLSFTDHKIKVDRGGEFHY